MKILVIEDTKKHLEDAKAVLLAAGHEVVVARTLEEAGRYLSSSWGDAEVRVDGVITDIHFPMSTLVDGSQDYTDASLPCGLSVAMRCEKYGVPFVFCTDGYHHGNKLEWINQLSKEMNWVMVDGDYPKSTNWDEIYVTPAPAKAWQKALALLERRVSEKS